MKSNKGGNYVERHIQERTIGQRTAGVLSIVLGSVYAVGGLMAALAVTAVASTRGTTSITGFGTLQFLSWVILALGVSMVVLGSSFCRNHTQRGVAFSLLLTQLLLIGLSAWSTAVTSTLVSGAGYTATMSAGWLGYIFSSLIILFSLIHIFTSPAHAFAEEERHAKIRH